MFALIDIPEKVQLCTIPGIFVYCPTLQDKQRVYLWKTNEIFQDQEVFFDSSCFSKAIIGADGFGHLINTSHPYSVRREHREPNCRYVDVGNGVMVVESIKSIKANEELLCDYHWHLSEDEVDASSDSFRALSEQCYCEDCELSRQDHIDFMKHKVKFGIHILKATSELQVAFLKSYYSHSVDARVGGLQLVRSLEAFFPNEISQLSFQDVVKEIDDTIPVSRPHRTFLQLGSNLGFECLAACCYMENVSSALCVSTEISNSWDVQKVRDTISSSTFQDVLDSKGSTFSTLVVDTWNTSSLNLISSVCPAIMYISPDVPDSSAILMAISAVRCSSLEAIVTFSGAVIDAVKNILPKVKTVLCSNIANVEVRPCYILLKQSGRVTRRTPEEDISALKYWLRTHGAHFPSSAIAFNEKSIEDYELQRLKRGLTFVKPKYRLIENDSHIGGATHPTMMPPKSTNRDHLVVPPSSVGPFFKRKLQTISLAQSTNELAMITLPPLSKKQCQKLELSTGGGFMRANLVQKFFNFENTGMIWREECALPPESFRKRMGFVNIDTIFGIPANSNPSFHVSKALWEAEKMYSDINIEILCGITRLAIEECSATKGKVGLLPPSFFSTVEHIPSMNLSASSWERMHPNLSIQCLETLICIMHGNSHYAVLQVDFQTFQVTVHDSLYGVVDWDSYVQAVLKFVFVTRKIETKIWEIVQNSTMPQQGNGTDCGVYAAATSMLLALNAPRASWAYQLRNPNALRCLFATMFLDCVNYLNNEQALPHRLGLSNGSPPITFLNSMASSASASGSVTGSSRIMNKRHAADKSLTTLDYGLLVKISGLTQSDLYLERYCD